MGVGVICNVCCFISKFLQNEAIIGLLGVVLGFLLILLYELFKNRNKIIFDFRVPEMPIDEESTMSDVHIRCVNIGISICAIKYIEVNTRWLNRKLFRICNYENDNNIVRLLPFENYDYRLTKSNENTLDEYSKKIRFSKKCNITIILVNNKKKYSKLELWAFGL